MTDQDESANVEDLTLARTVTQSITKLNLPDTDKAAERLARVYARAIDRGEQDLEKIGPKLLDVLEALGATPRSRARLKQTGTKTGGKLQNFRAAS